MDQHAVPDNSSASFVEEAVPNPSVGRIATSSVSAGIAAANAHLSKVSGAEPRFPGEDGGHSLAEMAQRDLEAALQLLADRAQYITGASGAAIALRRGEHADMLCRASAGANAPELGALLSMEYGLSGESVRSRKALRCDDTESDARVNREGCRQLGIASVLVMPIVSDGQVLGVFELFSREPRAFDERDLSALQRLSEMVETAVRHAVAAQTVPGVEEPLHRENEAPADETTVEIADHRPVAIANGPELACESAAEVIPASEPEKIEPEETRSAPSPQKPLFWSAAMRAAAGASAVDTAAPSITAPPVLRHLQKCQACGFPVSQGRTFCVECEEKQWRGQSVPQTAAALTHSPTLSAEPAPANVAASDSAAAASTPAASLPSASMALEADAPETSVALSSESPHLTADPPHADGSLPFSSPAAKSWFAANKYTLGALLAVALVIGVIVWLR
jgi:hypothetical protein